MAYLLLQQTGSAQSKWVVENYSYLGQPGEGTIVPMIHMETKKNWYAELRYNYEDAQTLSLFAGKTLAGGKGVTYSVTPLAGFSVGNFTGISLGVNTDIEWKNFYVSAQSQYSMGTKKEVADFFFNWSELGYNITPSLFAGLAMQYTVQSGSTELEPGFVAGLAIKNFSFPLYVFSPFQTRGYFVVGFNYVFSLNKKK